MLGEFSIFGSVLKILVCFAIVFSHPFTSEQRWQSGARNLNIKYFTNHTFSMTIKRGKLMWREEAIRVHPIACMCEAVRRHGVVNETMLLYKERFGYSTHYIWMVITCKYRKQGSFQTSQRSNIPASSRHSWTVQPSALMPHQVSRAIIVSNQNSQKLQSSLSARWVTPRNSFQTYKQAKRQVWTWTSV